MRKLWSIYFNGQFGLFLLCSGSALVLNWLSRMALSLFLPFSAAVLIAYGIGMLTAYLLSKRYVFTRSGNSMRREVALFITANVMWLPIIWAASVWLGDVVLAPYLPQAAAHAAGHAVAITLPALANFAFHKFLTFREHPAGQS